MLSRLGVDPNVMYGGLLVLAIAAGVGEYFHVVPAGTTTFVLGSIIGGGGVHAGVSLANGAAKTTATAASEVSAAAAQVAATAANTATLPTAKPTAEGKA